MSEIDNIPEGGRGIKIMSQIADELSYTRTPDNKNCLFIVKTYEQQSIDQSSNAQKGSVLKRLNGFFKSKSQPQQPCNTPCSKIRLKVNTDLQCVDQVLDWYEHLANLPIPQTVFWQCQLVLVEGFTNAVRHAHNDLPSDTPIELEIAVFKESLEIRIWDCGQPFDLEAKLCELREVDQDISEGGRSLTFAPSGTQR